MHKFNRSCNSAGVIPIYDKDFSSRNVHTQINTKVTLSDLLEVSKMGQIGNCTDFTCHMLCKILPCETRKGMEMQLLSLFIIFKRNVSAINTFICCINEYWFIFPGVKADMDDGVNSVKALRLRN